MTSSTVKNTPKKQASTVNTTDNLKPSALNHKVTEHFDELALNPHNGNLNFSQILISLRYVIFGGSSIIHSPLLFLKACFKSILGAVTLCFLPLSFALLSNKKDISGFDIQNWRDNESDNRNSNKNNRNPNNKGLFLIYAISFIPALILFLLMYALTPKTFGIESNYLCRALDICKDNNKALTLDEFLRHRTAKSETLKRVMVVSNERLGTTGANDSGSDAGNINLDDNRNNDNKKIDEAIAKLLAPIPNSLKKVEDKNKQDLTEELISKKPVPEDSVSAAAYTRGRYFSNKDLAASFLKEIDRNSKGFKVKNPAQYGNQSLGKENKNNRSGNNLEASVLGNGSANEKAIEKAIDQGADVGTGDDIGDVIEAATYNDLSKAGNGDKLKEDVVAESAVSTPRENVNYIYRLLFFIVLTTWLVFGGMFSAITNLLMVRFEFAPALAVKKAFKSIGFNIGHIVFFILLDVFFLHILSTLIINLGGFILHSTYFEMGMSLDNLNLLQEHDFLAISIAYFIVSSQIAIYYFAERLVNNHFKMVAV